MKSSRIIRVLHFAIPTTVFRMSPSNLRWSRLRGTPALRLMFVSLCMLISQGCRQEPPQISATELSPFISQVMDRLKNDDELRELFEFGDGLTPYVQPNPNFHDEFFQRYLDSRSRRLKCEEFQNCVITSADDIRAGETGNMLFEAMYRTSDGYSAVFFAIINPSGHTNWVAIFGNDSSHTLLDVHLLGGS